MIEKYACRTFCLRSRTGGGFHTEVGRMICHFIVYSNAITLTTCTAFFFFFLNMFHLSGTASNKSENLHLLAMKREPTSVGKSGLVMGEELSGLKQL